MKRVAKAELRSGLMLAERLVDGNYNVLLEANARLSEEHVKILQTWDIDYIRIREPKDTDESLKIQLKVDRMLAQREKAYKIDEKRLAARLELGIFKENIISILSGNGDTKLYSEKKQVAHSAVSIKIGTVFETRALDQYQRMLHVVAGVFNDDPRSREMFFRNSNEMAGKICNYVERTTGVIGYSLYTQKVAVAELAAHTMRTAVIAGKIAQLLKMDAKARHLVVLGALMHDIGLSSLPMEIRRKIDFFSPEEEKEYRKHVYKGIEMLRDRPYIPKEVVLIVGSHHEKLDGSGYPLKLKGDKIHRYVRVVSLSDKFDEVMNPEDVLAPAYTLPEVINEIPFWCNEYDPRMCATLRQYLEEFIMCNRVTLSDGRRGEMIWRHHKYSQPIIRTNDGEFIDMNKMADIKILSYSI